MYSDRRKYTGRNILLLFLAVILIFAGARRVAASSAGRLGEAGETAIAEAIRRQALQCYAVEGVYPPDLAYLEENYGLNVNTSDYYITYNAFASNLPPEVIVQVKR